MKFKFHTIFYSAVLFVVNGSVAADGSSENEDDKPGLLSSVGSAVDGAHENVNTKFKNFVGQVDDFIGTAEDGETINTSWARVRLDAIEDADGEIELKAKIKLRLVLPQSEKRFRLLLSSGEEDAGADGTQREQLARDDEEVALALRFLRKVRERSSVKFDVGARWRDDKAQLFGRIGAVVQKPIDENWTFTASNDYYQYSSSGYENRMRFDFRRLLFGSDRLYLRSASEVRWLEGNKGASIGAITGVYADRGPKAAYALEILANGITSKNDGAEDYYQGTELRLRIRRNAFRPWLFFEIWPTVSWAAINDYEQTYGGRVRVELNFGR